MADTYGENCTEIREILADDFKEALCNSMAIAGIENVMGTDQSEVWTVLGEEEPDGYDYEADEHTDVIERATNFLANELRESLDITYGSFIDQLQLNDAYGTFWMHFCDLKQTNDIDKFNDGLQNILEKIG